MGGYTFPLPGALLPLTCRVKAMSARTFLSRALTGGIAAGFLTTVWAMRETTRFQLKEITLEILQPGALQGQREFTILHISDLHMVASQEEKQRWVASLDALNPDLVINTGDNLSDSIAVPAVLRALNPLLRRPGLFVFGTNDYFAPKMFNPLVYLTGKKRKASTVPLPWKGMRAAFVEHGWVDLTHNRHEFKVGPLRLAAAGVDDPHHNLDDYEQVAGRPHPDADLSIAVLHTPEPRVLERFAQDGYMLSFSGHTHGGQVCRPDGKAIVTNCGIDPVRSNGLHSFGSMVMHVSNGLGQSRFAPIRLFCRPSATLLRLLEKPAQ